MRCVPHIMRGFFASAVQSACDEIVADHEEVDFPRLERVWKLLLLLPRTLLMKPRGEAVSSPGRSWSLFSASEWHILMRQSVQSCEEVSRAATRRSQTRPDTIEHRAGEAERLVLLERSLPQGCTWKSGNTQSFDPT